MKPEEDAVVSVLLVFNMIKFAIMEYVLFGCLCFATLSFAFLMLTLALKQIRDLRKEKKLEREIKEKRNE